MSISAVHIDKIDGNTARHIECLENDIPDDVGMVSLLFGAKGRVAPPYLAAKGVKRPMSPTTKARQGEDWGIDIMFSIYRSELEKFTRDLVIEDRRPAGHGSPLPEEEPGVMTTAGEYFGDHTFAFIKSLIDSEGDVFHFFINF